MRKEEADVLEVNNNKADSSVMDKAMVHTSERSNVNLIVDKRKTKMKKLIQSLSLRTYLVTYRNFLQSLEKHKIKQKGALKFVKTIRKLDKYAWPLSPDLAIKLKNLLGRETPKQAPVGRKPMKPDLAPVGRKPMKPDLVLQAVKTLLKLMKGNKVFSEHENPVFVQMTCVKMPITSRHPFFIKLPHSHLSESSDVCLITGDLRKNGKAKDYENTAEVYKKCLKRHGATKISEIITILQLKREYEVYEMKRALFKKFDFFMVDRKIWSLASHHLGREIRKSKTPIPVCLKKTKYLHKHINAGLRTTVFWIHPTGNTFSFRVGHRHLEATKIRDNIIVATEALRKGFPGGWKNILSLSIKGLRTKAVPLHLSVELSSSVQVPVERPIEHAPESHIGPLEGGYVQVDADGKVVYHKNLEMQKEIENEAWKSCGKVYVDV